MRKKIHEFYLAKLYIYVSSLHLSSILLEHPQIFLPEKQSDLWNSRYEYLNIPNDSPWANK